MCTGSCRVLQGPVGHTVRCTENNMTSFKQKNGMIKMAFNKYFGQLKRKKKSSSLIVRICNFCFFLHYMEHCGI